MLVGAKDVICNSTAEAGNAVTSRMGVAKEAMKVCMWATQTAVTNSVNAVIESTVAQKVSHNIDFFVEQP